MVFALDETEVLPSFIPRKRWSGSTTNQVQLHHINGLWHWASKYNRTSFTSWILYIPRFDKNYVFILFSPFISFKKTAKSYGFRMKLPPVENFKAVQLIKQKDGNTNFSVFSLTHRLMKLPVYRFGKQNLN